MKDVTALAIFLVSANGLFAGTISRSFELRYVSDDVKADGASDFKGLIQFLMTSNGLNILRPMPNTLRGILMIPGWIKRL